MNYLCVFHFPWSQIPDALRKAELWKFVVRQQKISKLQVDVLYELNWSKCQSYKHTDLIWSLCSVSEVPTVAPAKIAAAVSAAPSIVNV